MRPNYKITAIYTGDHKEEIDNIDSFNLRILEHESSNCYSSIIRELDVFDSLIINNDWCHLEKLTIERLGERDT